MTEIFVELKKDTQVTLQVFKKTDNVQEISGGFMAF